MNLKKTYSRKLLPVQVAFAAMLTAAGASVSASEFIEDSAINLKTRFVHFDRDYETESNDRAQAAIGLELNYSSGYISDFVGVDISGYHGHKLGASGLERSDILSINNDGEFDDAVSLIGQAYLKFKFGEIVTAKVGRQKAKTMFIGSSSSRALPNTFRGISARADLGDIAFYGAVFDEWSRRHDDHFEGFKTDRSEEGAIDRVSVLGAKYKKDTLTVELESLRSEDYLRKMGVRASYGWSLAENGKIKLSGGYFTSQDDGDLFVTKAESGDLDDEDVAGSISGVTPSENDGQGYYVDLTWKKGSWLLGTAYASFDDIWIEDNFSGDHGTNPFPTRSGVGPDMTNAGETVWQVRVGYDWSSMISGLTTTLKFSSGSDAENSADPSLGSADEQFTELDVKWKLAFVKGMKVRWKLGEYRSDETGRVDGVKSDQFNSRFYIDYTYKF